MCDYVKLPRSRNWRQVTCAKPPTMPYEHSVLVIRYEKSIAVLERTSRLSGHVDITIPFIMRWSFMFSSQIVSLRYLTFVRHPPLLTPSQALGVYLVCASHNRPMGKSLLLNLNSSVAGLCWYSIAQSYIPYQQTVRKACGWCVTSHTRPQYAPVTLLQSFSPSDAYDEYPDETQGGFWISAP